MHLGIAAWLIYLVIARTSWPNGLTPVAVFLSLFSIQFAIVFFAQSRIDGRTMMAGAILFRVTMLAAGFHDGEWERFLLYDSDIWRYLWDGHMLRAGVNPYSVPPDQFVEQNAAWGFIRDFVNYSGIPTIYPPLAQLLFAVTPGSVLAMKIAVTALDLLALHWLIQTLRLQNRPATDAIWYAWNPLVIKAFAGSGHVDALLVAALAGMLRFSGSSSRELGALAAAVLAKWSPLALLPLMARRHGFKVLWLLPILAPVFWIPGVFDGARAFAEFWRFNAWFPQAAPAKGLAALALAAYWGLQKKNEGDLEDFARQVAYILGAVIVLAPAVMPWYVTWLLPAAIIARTTVWIGFSGLVFAAFAVVVDGQERWWVLAIEYGVFAGWIWKDRHELRFSTNPHHADSLHGAG